MILYVFSRRRLHDFSLICFLRFYRLWRAWQQTSLASTTVNIFVYIVCCYYLNSFSERMFFFPVGSLLNTYHDAFVHTSLKESSNIVIEVCLGDYRLSKWHWDASFSHLKFQVKNCKRLLRIWNLYYLVWFGGCLGLWLIKFRNNSRYKQVLRCCKVSEKKSVFENKGTGFLVWRFFRSQKSMKISWNAKKSILFYFPWYQSAFLTVDGKKISTFLDGWRLNFRPFDGWRLTPSRPSLKPNF